MSAPARSGVTNEYTSSQVCAIAGITYRQLDHWTRSGRLEAVDAAPGHGCLRYYRRRDVEIARYVAGLLAHGLTLDIAFETARAPVDSGEVVRRGGGITLRLYPLELDEAPV